MEGKGVFITLRTSFRISRAKYTFSSLSIGSSVYLSRQGSISRKPLKLFGPEHETCCKETSVHIMTI